MVCDRCPSYGLWSDTINALFVTRQKVNQNCIMFIFNVEIDPYIYIFIIHVLVLLSLFKGFWLKNLQMCLNGLLKISQLYMNELRNNDL